MSDSDLTQAEADALIAMEKHRLDDSPWIYLSVGGSLSVPLVSADRQQNFMLDMSRGRIDLSKGKYQNRGRQIVVLVRLDFGGPPHRNPDGQEIACPHLHVYREGFGDKWAQPVPRDRFPDPSDLWETLHHFMAFCNITKPPLFQRGLFP